MAVVGQDWMDRKACGGDPQCLLLLTQPGPALRAAHPRELLNRQTGRVKATTPENL